MVTSLMIQIADLLNTIIFSNSVIFINFWSLIHITFGFFLMKLFLINKKNRFLKLFGLLVLYEIFEFLVIASGSSLFRVEISIDIIYDLIFGLLGGWLAIKLNR